MPTASLAEVALLQEGYHVGWRFECGGVRGQIRVQNEEASSPISTAINVTLPTPRLSCTVSRAPWAGWPRRLPAGAPTDPDVRALAHPVPRPAGLPSTSGPVAIQASYGDMLIEPRWVRHVSLAQVCRPALRFPPQGPPGRVPLLRRYHQSAATSCRSSRRASFPSLGGTSACTRSVRSWTDECAAQAWSW
jgi:hypothetical protein